MQTGPWPRAPRELLNGEKEVDFEHKRKVHICDGIDTGNMQYATKGLVEKDLFRVPKVCIFIDHRNNIFDDSASTFLTILQPYISCSFIVFHATNATKSLLGQTL